MAAIFARIVVLAALAALCWGIVRVGQRYVEAKRRSALSAAPLPRPVDNTSCAGTSARVRILAFSSDDCAQCHRMQAPALARVREARPDGVVVVEEVDAPSSPELAGRYSVLTVPTTVVLDAAGRAHAVNYGFAGTNKLLEQVDAALAASAPGGTLELAPRA